MGTWNTPDKRADLGFLVTILAWPFYISNGAILLCPLLVALFKRLKRVRIVLASLVVLYIATPFATLLFRDAILDVAPGFYFWVASYFVAAIGTAFSIPPKKQSEQGGDGDAEEAV
jgi:peptidoglycan/LPS O-acetylase OafA/YrhL